MEKQYMPGEVRPARTVFRISKEELIFALKQLVITSGVILPDGKYFIWHPSESRNEHWEITLGVDHDT